MRAQFSMMAAFWKSAIPQTLLLAAPPTENARQVRMDGANSAPGGTRPAVTMNASRIRTVPPTTHASAMTTPAIHAPARTSVCPPTAASTPIAARPAIARPRSAPNSATTATSTVASTATRQMMNATATRIVGTSHTLRSRTARSTSKSANGDAFSLRAQAKTSMM